jgi:hypothetical protein
MPVRVAVFDGALPRDRPAISLGRIVSQLVYNLLLGSAATATVGIAALCVTLAAAWLTFDWVPKHSDLPQAKFSLRQLALEPQYPVRSTGLGPADIVVFPPSVAQKPAAPVRIAERSTPKPEIGLLPPVREKPTPKAASVPLPPAMPAELAQLRKSTAEPVAATPVAKPVEKQVASVPPPLPPAGPERRVAPQRAEPKVATLPAHDSHTAVYDIAAHTVFLPDGRKLEAHSGLGRWRDDPRYVTVKNRGPTPPNVYDLTLRESLFHGVRAIRLTPVNEKKMFGRDGMLAHTYMLGAGGDSNGCGSFKNYQAFLQAYLRGEVDRLVVVAHRGAIPIRSARAPGNERMLYAENEP